MKMASLQWLMITVTASVLYALALGSESRAAETRPEIAASEAPQPTAPPLPSFTMKECEVDSCGLWTFTGEEGEARWPKGQVASLTRQPWENGEVVVHRRDVRGMSKGLTAVYTGTRKGGRIEGTVTWTFSNGRQASGTWSADIDDVSVDEAAARQTDADTRHDSFEALRWLVAGAALGDAAMENDAGAAFSLGYGLPRDYAKARTLFLAAAEQGAAAAQVNLGRIYEQGLGVARDQAQADAWYKKAGPQAVAAANAIRDRDRAAATAERAALAKQTQQLLEEYDRRRLAAEEACKQSEECRKQMEENARRDAAETQERRNRTYLDQQREQGDEWRTRQLNQYQSQHGY